MPPITFRAPIRWSDPQPRTLNPEPRLMLIGVIIVLLSLAVATGASAEEPRVEQELAAGSLSAVHSLRPFATAQMFAAQPLPEFGVRGSGFRDTVLPHTLESRVSNRERTIVLKRAVTVWRVLARGLRLKISRGGSCRLSLAPARDPSARGPEALTEGRDDPAPAAWLRQAKPRGRMSPSGVTRYHDVGMNIRAEAVRGLWRWDGLWLAWLGRSPPT